jgi:hypothetical protein
VAVHVRGLEGPIRCTPEHPIWSRTRERWVGVGELEVGEELAGLEGGEEPPSGGAGAAAAAHAPALVVERVVWGEAPAEVWNLEVHRAHTYRVGGAGVLVHNSSSPECGGSGKPKYHYDKSSKDRRKAYEKAKSESAPGMEPDFDLGHNGGPDHYHPVDKHGERVPGRHTTWREEWERTRP